MPSDPTAPPAEEPLVPPFHAAPHATAASYYASTPPHPPGPAHVEWPQPQPAGAQASELALRTSRTALGWAIASGVGVLLSLVGMAFTFGLAASAKTQAKEASALAADAQDVATEANLVYGPLRGVVWDLRAPGPLAGDLLEQPLTDLLAENGPDVQGLTCPDTALVTVSTAVVCTANTEDSIWTGIVYFEDTEGSFVVLEL